MADAVVIDICHIIKKRKIEKLIREQLTFLGLSGHFYEECLVNFINGKPEYVGIIWDRQNGDYLQLGPTYCVTKALANL